MKQPNILYIHTHDTGRSIQPYGSGIPTPNLQKLAEQGMLFRRAYCSSPLCSPSRATLLTGRYPHQCGMFGLSHRGHRLNDYSQHIVHTLKTAGYLTALSGTQHVWDTEDNDGLLTQLGYDRYLGDADRTQMENETIAHTRAVEFLHNAPDQPFFLSVGFHETHRPFPELDEDDRSPHYVAPPLPLADTEETRLEMARFRKMAITADDQIGQVLDALETTGLAENTLVISTTDHGIPFPRHKTTLYDGGLGVFLIMRGPGGFTGGRCSDSLVGHVNIFATLCDVAGIPTPDWVQGPSLLPLAENPNAIVQDHLYGETNYQGDDYQPARSIRTSRFNFIRRFETEASWDSMKSVGTNVMKSFLNEAELPCSFPHADEELYDSLLDPMEMRNVIDDPAYSQVAAKLQQELSSWMKRTQDPLATQGYVPAPSGQVPGGLPSRFIGKTTCSAV